MLKERWPPLIITLATFVLVMLIQQSGALEPIELKLYDLNLEWKNHPPADQRVVIIGETEEDLRRFGHPLPDSTLARIIDILNRSKVRVIGIDKYRDIPVPGGDKPADLKQTLKHSPNVVWIFKFGQGGQATIAPPEIIQGTDQVGFNDLPPDHDGVMRRGLLFLDDGQVSYPSFSLNIALRWLQKEGVAASADPDNHQVMMIGSTPIPPLPNDFGGYRKLDNRGYQFMLGYPGLPDHFATYSLSDLLDGRIPERKLADRVVLFGGMAESLNDRLLVPIANQQGEVLRADLFGVELQGFIISQLINLGLQGEATLASVSNSMLYLWLLVWVSIAAIVGSKLHGSWHYALVFVLGLLLLVGVGQWALRFGLWLPSTAPMLGWTLALLLVGGYLAKRERDERRTMMQIFSRHVSHDVAQNIWQKRQELMQEGQLRPQKLTATVLFTDIKGFTTVSERLSSEALMEWLNAYMDAMTGVVLEHGGVINKYIGDAIMVMFGVPFPRQKEDEIKKDAQDAVACAKAMAKALKSINQKLVADGFPPVAMRVGVYTGPLVAGSLGSSDRQEYTVIGDTVNVASRLESYGKSKGDQVIESTECRILIGESTYQYLEQSDSVTAVGSVKLKGKEEAITIYQVDDGRARAEG